MRRTPPGDGEAEDMGLVFVPTPLGNLRDVTLRSLDTLRDASLIVAEDSRVARRLLGALDIGAKEIWTYHEHNARTATGAIVARARDALVAVVTDAGTPGISDPGSALVAAARADGVACFGLLEISHAAINLHIIRRRLLSRAINLFFLLLSSPAQWYRANLRRAWV